MIDDSVFVKELFAMSILARNTINITGQFS